MTSTLQFEILQHYNVMSRSNDMDIIIRLSYYYNVMHRKVKNLHFGSVFVENISSVGFTYTVVEKYSNAFSINCL